VDIKKNYIVCKKISDNHFRLVMRKCTVERENLRVVTNFGLVVDTYINARVLDEYTNSKRY
jgi:hypothetical protein